MCDNKCNVNLAQLYPNIYEQTQYLFRVASEERYIRENNVVLLPKANLAFARSCLDIVAGNTITYIAIYKHKNEIYVTRPSSSFEMCAIAIGKIDMLCVNFNFRNIEQNIR